MQPMHLPHQSCRYTNHAAGFSKFPACMIRSLPDESAGKHHTSDQARVHLIQVSRRRRQACFVLGLGYWIRAILVAFIAEPSRQSDALMAPLTIADQARAAKNCLGQLLSETKQRPTTGEIAIQSSTIEDLLERFVLWAGSLGALQAPAKKLSLDYRLEDAPDVRDQICEYLENLQEATEDREWCVLKLQGHL